MAGSPHGRRTCLGEWRGRGKTIKITRSETDELFVDMGPGVPPLTLVAASSSSGHEEEIWPMKWAVMRRAESGRPSGTPQGTVYIFELPSSSSSTLLVKKPTGDGVVEFERVVDGSEPRGVPHDLLQQKAPPRGPSSPTEAAGGAHGSRSRSPHARGKMSFADSLAKIVSERKVAHTDRERLSSCWLAYEAKLLDTAVDLFKQRCIREAECQRCGATISFEVLSREIEDFPKRALSGSTYFVGTWGEGVSAESWFYATRGVTASFSPVQVLFAEVLQGMLPKFVERVRSLGFQSCSHEAGTWKISVTWRKPDPP